MSLRFLFDEHVNKPACHALQERGVDVVHVLDVGLSGSPDSEVLARAAAESRIVVTRNYRDFARLAEAYRAHGRHFPGILFLPAPMAQWDVGAHVRAVGAWIAAETARNPDIVRDGRSSVADGFGWLAAP